MIDRSTERRASGAGGPSGAATALAGEVMGSALVRARPSELPALRKRPGPVPDGWTRTPPSLLRYSDEQTVAATAAVFAAIAAMGATPDAFAGWGVVAASRYLGRANLAVALRSFRAEGVWGTSPHLIPHFALHSPSGTISLALGLHGPNVGAGGGLHAATEGFLAALTWLAAGIVPGVWLVLSGWSPELVPERPGPAKAAADPRDDLECQALAIAVRPASAEGGPRFRLRVDDASGLDAVPAPVDLARLARDLERSAESPCRTVATDPAGRVRVDLIGGQRGPR